MLKGKLGYKEVMRKMTLPMLREDKVLLFTFCGLGLLIAAILTKLGGYDFEKRRFEAEMLILLTFCIALPVVILGAVIQSWVPRWSIFFRTQRILARSTGLLLDGSKCSVLVLSGGAVFYILFTGTVPFLLVVYYHLLLAEILTRAATGIKGEMRP